MTSEDDDGVPVRIVLGANIKRIRVLRKMTVRDLAARVKGLGLPLSASGVSEVENGQRKIGADELLILAVALNTSIVELITPDDRRNLRISDEIEPIPEGYLDWWLRGVHPWPKDANADEFFEAASPIRQHDRLMRKRPDVKAVDYLAALVYDAATAVELMRDEEQLRRWAADETPRLRELLDRANSYVKLLIDELESHTDGG